MNLSLNMPRWQSITSLVLRLLTALLFLFAAVTKLSGNPMMIDEFNQVGLGQWFRYATAILEVVGALALLPARAAAYGALLLLAVDIGALVAQLTRIHMDWIHTIIVGALLTVIIYLHRGTLARDPSGRSWPGRPERTRP